MLKAYAKSELGDVISLGVSKGNVNRLLAGDPIRIWGKDIGQPQIAVVLIYYGETEEAMEVELRSAGLVGPETVMVRAS